MYIEKKNQLKDIVLSLTTQPFEETVLHIVNSAVTDKTSINLNRVARLFSSLSLATNLRKSGESLGMRSTFKIESSLVLGIITLSNYLE